MIYRFRKISLGSRMPKSKHAKYLRAAIPSRAAALLASILRNFPKIKNLKSIQFWNNG